MEYLFLAVTILALVVLYAIKCLAEEKSAKKKFVKKLYEDYGKSFAKEYPPGRLDTIAGYHNRRNKENVIDDITWNDLDMDRIFKSMDFTFSAAGEEALYATLRCPEVEEEILTEREKRIVYFMEHADERVKLQLLFAKIGRTGRYSMFDYLDYLEVLPDRKNFKHYLGIALLVGSVIFMGFQFEMGFFLFLLCSVVNMLLYFRDKAEISAYISTFSYFIRLLDSLSGFIKAEIPVIEKETKVFLAIRQKFQKFIRFSWIVTVDSGLSSNPLALFGEYGKMVLHLDLIKFNRMLRHIRENKKELIIAIGTLGEIERDIAVGAYRRSLSNFCVPQFLGMGTRKVHMQEAYHPLLENPVCNSFREEKSMLLTGSNASGKSTFLKTVAINVILAQTIHTCAATEYSAGMFRILSSMSLRDDLAGGNSYFMVEIKSLKRILDVIRGTSVPVICFVDEVLRGTNTVERIAASTEILKSLRSDNSMCFAATHDIELTELLEKEYDNYHFEETIVENDVRFNYRLKNGKATTRNAIRLLAVLGYEDTIIEKAEERAERFVNDGIWS